jgi:hypothetical protein
VELIVAGLIGREMLYQGNAVGGNRLYKFLGKRSNESWTGGCNNRKAGWPRLSR